MTVKIKRSTGFLEMSASFWIMINDEKKEKIRNNQTNVISLPSDSVTLQVTQQGVKSKEMMVRPGDEVEINTTLLGKFILPLLILSPMIANIFPNLDIRMILLTSILILLLFLTVFFFIPGAIFRIQKLDTKPW